MSGVDFEGFNLGRSGGGGLTAGCGGNSGDSDLSVGGTVCTSAM